MNGLEVLGLLWIIEHTLVLIAWLVKDRSKIPEEETT